MINNSIPVLFADDTSVIITNSTPTDFQKDIKDVFEHLNTWFTLSLLSLNFDKTKFIHFKTKNTRSLDIRVEYDNRFIANTYFTRFIGLTIDNMLYWKSHKMNFYQNLVQLVMPLELYNLLCLKKHW